LAKVPATPLPPLEPEPVVVPPVRDKKSFWTKLTEAQGAVIAAAIGGVFIVIAALIGILPGLLNRSTNATNTPQPMLQTATSPTLVSNPTVTPTQSDTPDFVVLALTFDAGQAATQTAILGGQT